MRFVTKTTGLEIGTHAVFLLLSLVALHRLIISPGTIAVSYDWSIPPYPEQLKMKIMDLTWSIQDGALGAEGFWANLWTPTISWVVGAVGLGGEFLSKFYVLVAVWGSGTTMFYLLKTVGLKRFPSFAASIVYMSNPLLFNRLAAGHLAYVYGLVFSPLAIAYFVKAMKSRRWTEWLRATLTCALFYSISAVNIHGIIPIFLIILSYALADIVQRKRFLTRNLGALLASTALAVSSHVNLLFNLMDYDLKIRTGTGPSLVNARSAAWISQNQGIFKALVLDGWVGDSFTDTLQQRGLDLWFISALTIAVLALLGAALKRRDPHVVVWTPLTATFLVIMAGTTTWPGAVLWDLAYAHARPLASLYADSYHLAIVPALGIPILLAIFANSELKGFKANPTRNLLRSKKRPLLVLSLLILAASYSVPALTMYGDVLQTYTWHPAYRELYDKLSQSDDRDDYRMLWLPTIAYAISYKGHRFGGLDPMIIYPPMASFPQLLGVAALATNVERHQAYVNLVVDEVSPYTDRHNPIDHKTKYLGQLLALSGVRYIALRSDAYTTQRFDIQYNVSRAILDEQRGIDLVAEMGPIRLYQNSEALPLVYASSLDETSLITGSSSNLIPLMYLTSETSVLPRQKAFIFSNLLKGRELEDHLHKVRNVVLDGEGFRGLQFSLLPDEYLHGLEPYVGNSKGWSMGGVGEGVISYPPGQGAKATLNFALPASPGRYEVWAKTLHGPSSKSLSINLAHSAFATLNTSALMRGHSWAYVGEVAVGDSPLQVGIEGEGEEGIAGLVVAPKASIKDAEMRVNELLGRKRVVTVMEAEQTSLNGWPLVATGSSASGGAALNTTREISPLTFRFYSPSAGPHEIYLRVKPSHGFLDLTLRSEATASSHRFVMSPRPGFSWVKFTGQLAAGWHALDVSSTLPGNLVDMAAVKHPYRESVKNSYTFHFERASQVKFVGHLESDEPLFIVLSYNDNPYWEGVASGRSFEKVQANGFAQAFYVPNPGRFEVKIEYTRQQAFEIARAISLSAIAIVISGNLLITASRRNGRSVKAN